MKNIMMALLFVASFAGLSYAGETSCVNGNCRVLRSRSVVVSQEIVNIPVTVTKKTVNSCRRVGRRLVNKSTEIVR